MQTTPRVKAGAVFCESRVIVEVKIKKLDKFGS